MSQGGPTPAIVVREARPADAPAVTAIHRSSVVRWRRWSPEGDEAFARYEDLSAYERWQNGGPWMDETTCAAHLARFSPAGGGVALVAEWAGQAAAEAEAFAGEEPPPFGRNLNLAVLYTRRGYEGRGLGSALMAEIERRARALACETLMVSHAEAREFYARRGFAPQGVWRRARVPARQSGVQYTAAPLAGGDYEMIRGWAMPLGRYQSARQEWEGRRPGADPEFPEWRALRSARRQLTVRRQPAVLVLDEAPREPGWAEAYLWLPRELTRQHVAAVRDLAAREGFAGLVCFAAQAALPLLGPQAETDGYEQEVWLKRL